ncbi:MAG TPA: hypothetical protein VE954_11285 [Oligoflexus sp.]|uniref:hypothetical protein n=1 Tax=Oligoflexus sp. TaxID=1971216 RepID=UPI002D357A45|nr:hypothetical protein [Oligoflexus sp.]HYX33687.1 hypothetical protein [Oligoflexus sp.]
MSINKATKLFLAGSILYSASTPAWALDGTFSADYASAFVTDDPIMTFGLMIQQELHYGLKLSGAQSVNRNLVVDDSRKEWELNDSVVALIHKYDQSESVSLSTRLSTTLPISTKSKYDELRTRTELKLSAIVKLPADFTSTTTASYAQYWHKYDASRLEGQTAGGVSLPNYSYSLSQTIEYSLAEQVNLGASGSYRLRRWHNLEKTEGYIASENRLESYSYTVGAFTTYLYSDRTSLTVSYDQGSGLERPGYDDFVVYDSEQSTWTVSLLQLW